MLPLSNKDLRAMLNSSLAAPTPARKRRGPVATPSALAVRYQRATGGLAQGEYAIAQIRPTLFEVRKTDGSGAYKVRLGAGLPVCTCPDWQKHGHGHVCKHVLVVSMTTAVVAYVGYRMKDGIRVLVVREGKPDVLHHVVRHSPTGFEWGYLGSGPADLAYSILADYAGEDVAESLAVRFKEEVVARLPRTAWMLTDAALTAFLERHHVVFPLQDPAFASA